MIDIGRQTLMWNKQTIKIEKKEHGCSLWTSWRIQSCMQRLRLCIKSIFNNII